MQEVSTKSRKIQIWQQVPWDLHLVNVTHPQSHPPSVHQSCSPSQPAYLPRVLWLAAILTPVSRTLIFPSGYDQGWEQAVINHDLFGIGSRVDSFQVCGSLFQLPFLLSLWHLTQATQKHHLALDAQLNNRDHPFLVRALWLLQRHYSLGERSSYHILFFGNRTLGCISIMQSPLSVCFLYRLLTFQGHLS